LPGFVFSAEFSEHSPLRGQNTRKRKG